MRMIFVRHGESEANRLNVFSNRGWQHPLTPLGRQQVLALASKLSGRGISAIFASPLRRAVESAQILGECLGVRNEIEAALVEYDVGIYEGRGDQEGWECYAQLIRHWADGELDARMPGGESCNDIRRRFVPFIEQLIERFGTVPNATIVLVGHGGTYRHALPMVLGNIACDFAIAHDLGHTDLVEAELRGHELRCVCWGEILLP